MFTESKELEKGGEGGEKGRWAQLLWEMDPGHFGVSYLCLDGFRDEHKEAGKQQNQHQFFETKSVIYWRFCPCSRVKQQKECKGPTDFSLLFEPHKMLPWPVLRSD